MKSPLGFPFNNKSGVAMKKTNKSTLVKVASFFVIVATIFSGQGSAFAIAPTSTASATPSAARLNALPTGMQPSAANMMMMSMLDPYLPTTSLPDYFGPLATDGSGYITGNYANSPLPTSVMIQGPGSGAMYIAEYSAGGQITKFDMVNPGIGYDSTTLVSVIGGGGTGGKGGTMTFDTQGGITAISVGAAGSGYGSANGIRKFTQDLPDLAVAVPTPIAAVKGVTNGAVVNGPGNPNYIPASDAYEIAALRTQWQFSPDLGMTTVNLYVQVDTTYAGTNCPAGELNWKYPDGITFITNGAGQNVCFIQTNHDAATQALAPFSYLGPTIVANQGKPVRVTFDNYLPSGNMPCTTAGGTATGVNKCGGDLFLPVDSSTMGAGAGPNGGFYSPNRATIHLHGGVTPWISDGTNDQWVSPASSSEQYPAGVSTRYVPDMWYDQYGTEISSCYGFIYCFDTKATRGVYKGFDDKTKASASLYQLEPSTLPNSTTPNSYFVSNNPGNGRMTFYYTNQQTARLMFYHDHSDGITRLNVYSGLVAGYLLHDTQEGKVMVAAGVRDARAPNTPTAQEKVLVIQDKTFVGSIVQMQMQDPTWLTAGTDPAGGTSQVSAWGGFGSLWFPHVYMPNQNPGLTTVNSTSPGATPAGRWDYGPWFWPAVNTETYKPVPNPLYKTPCLAGTINNSCEYKDNPGTPNVSAAPEAFSDSMVVNGILFPIMHVANKVYRLQILNGSNDRTMSLSLFYAKTDPTNANYVPNLNDPFNKGCTTGGKTTLWTNPATDKTPNCGDAGEVAMVPAIKDTPLTPSPGTAGLVYPDQLQQQQDGLVPDMRTAGPDFVELASEGGILPDAAIFPATPVGYEFNNQSITLGNVKEHALILGPAQRADVLVDLTNVPAGATLILYNDAPAPFPGWDPRWYYQTGHADQTSTGGAPTILPGYAPNTQTIMQIKVDQAGTSPSIYDASGNLTAPLVTAIHNDYKASQDAPVVPQVEYNAALGTNTQTNVFPALGDSTFPVVSTGVSTVTVDAAGLAAAANVGTPQVLIGDQISATTLEAASSVIGGNGNGARGVPVMSTASGIDSVTADPTKTYVVAPTATSPTLPTPLVSGARPAIIKPVLAGSGDIATITVNQDANNVGYTATPNVVETGTVTSRVPVVATAVLAPTHIASFTLTNDSLAFTNTPNVSITGPRTSVGLAQQTATAVLTATPLRSIGVTNGGSYTLAPALTINGGATATAILSTSVAAITVTYAGSCTFSQAQNASSTYFQISLTGGGIGGATPVSVATASSTINASGTAASGSAAKLQSIRLLLGGAGYTANPAVTITPVGGITCTSLPTAVARLAAGPITSVVVKTFGSFTADPIITASTTNGSGAVFAPVLQPTSIASINLTGTTVTDFTGTPTVSLDIPSPISVTAVLAPTSVASIVVTPGTGLGYSTPPGIAIDPPSAGAPAATAVVHMATSHLAFTILDPGFGYTVGTSVTVNLSDGSTATATVGTGTLQSITVTNPGTGYLSAPTVALLYPDGTLDITHAAASLTSVSTNIVYHSTGIQELFDLDYARMNATMSSEVPFTAFNNQSTLPWSSVDSPTEIVNTNLPNALGGIGGSQVDALPDGTQIWRFTHNGVDTHFIHFHMFNVQILAVLGWDGVNQVLPAYDMGWRDTVQMDQLTTIYVAIKPIVPIVPWQIPNSLRPLDPQTNMFAANGSPITTQDPMMAAFDPSNTPVVAFNQLVNFGWEYMFHCHILGHEEADMMRPIPVGVVLTSPTALTTTYVAASGGAGAHVDVTFTDNSINETGFILQRRGSASESWITVAAATRPASTWDNIHQLVIDQGLSTGSTGTLMDSTSEAGNSYQYQVIAVDAIGTQNLGTFPSTTVASDPSNIVFVQR